MKKISICLTALLSLMLVSCNEDFFNSASPQSSEQESILKPSDVTVKELTSEIKIDNLVDSLQKDSIMIPMGVASVADGAMPANTVLKGTVQFSTTEDFQNPITISALSMDENDTVFISPSALQTAYYNNCTHSPKSTTLYTRTYLETVTDGSSVAYVGEPTYYNTRAITFTPHDTHVVLESAYYYLGAVSQNQDYKMSNGDRDPYDYPEFTVTVPALSNNDDWNWFRVAGASSYNADGSISWDKESASNTSICPTSNNCEDLEGSCTNGTNSWHLVQGNYPGVKYFTITVNVMDMKYTITPLYFNDYIYLAGDYNGWNGDSANPLAHLGDGQYEGYAYILKADDSNTWGFKFVDNGTWCGGDHAVATSGSVEKGGGGNLNTETGFYQVKADWVNLTYQLTKVNSITVVGNHNGWNQADAACHMTFNTTDNCWEATLNLTADGFKFAMNDNWDISWGGADGNPANYDNLSSNGGKDLNLPNGAGTYKIQLYLYCEGKNKVVLTKQ